jgi:hypothetical protein
MNSGPGGCGEPLQGICPPHGGRICAVWCSRLTINRETETNGRPAACAPAVGPACWVHLPDRPARCHPIRGRSGTDRRGGGKSRKSCWRRAGRGLLTVLAQVWAGSRRGRGMDSVTRGSGIALSVLIAATATILLLLPGKPAGPGTPGRVVMSSAVATSAWGPPGPGSKPSASSRAGGQPAAGSRPGCRATGAHSGRTQAGLATLRPGRARPGAARPRSCRPPRTHRH